MGNETERRYTAAEKRKLALQLRIAGLTYRDIAEEVGWKNQATAYRAVKDELGRIPRDAATELRDLELQRLDEAQAAIFAAVRQGDVFAIDRLAKIIDLRAKLTGTYTMPVENDANEKVKIAFAGLLDRAQRSTTDEEDTGGDDVADAPGVE